MTGLQDSKTMNKFTKLIKRPKEKSVSFWKKKVWKVFSLWLRTKYSNDSGMVRCYTCDKMKNWKEMQAGHALGGRRNSILFCERAVRPQCVGCNIFLRGNYAEFHSRLQKELGVGILDELIALDKVTKQYTVKELKSLYEKYESKTN